MFTFTNSEWLEASFQKRECAKIIPSNKDPARCCCGLPVQAHELPFFIPVSAKSGTDSSPGNILDPRPIPGEHWNPSKHTIPLPTDAYGCIDFRGAQTNKAQYIRLAFDTKPELVLSLLLREWCLDRPKLLITTTGGKANFELQPRIKRSLRRGLLKAAKTTGAWIFTGGTNTGVSKHVGDALMSEKSPRIKGGRVVSIGIAPWGIVDRRNELLGKKEEVAFHPVPQPRSRFASLNKHHAYFLLVDNGTVGKYGAELALRRKLEKFISTQSLSGSKGFSTPIVCLVIEGGTNTIRAVLEYVTATPPVPVVVCDGTGRAADLLAFAHKYAGEDGNLDLLSEMQEELTFTMMKTFRVNVDQAARLILELKQCVKRKNLITIYRCSGDREKRMELDEVIMTALFKAQHLSPTEQLSLALAWNRCDIATKEIFTYGQVWPPGALDHAMFEALDNDRVDFVRLLLEQGVNMNKFLTVTRLEALYNSRNGPANTLNYIVRDVVPRMSKGYKYNLIDIGLVINQLMGHGYCSTYTRRRFRQDYSELAALAQLPTKSNTMVSFEANGTHVLNKPKTFLRKLSRSNTAASIFSNLNSPPGPSPAHKTMLVNNEITFEYPFSELIVWAVLTKRQSMARLMWQHGEQAMAKALVASRLYQAMALEAADDDLDVEISDELDGYSKIFEDLSLQLLEFCYQSDDDLTQHLLTASLENWSRQTCLSLAVIANNLRFLAHPLSQVILADLWMGGLRMRKNPGFKILLGLVLPPTILQLEFKTKEELELMPQTEEELEGKEDSDTNSSRSSSSTSSRRSSYHGNADMDSLSSLELGDGRRRSGRRSGFRTDRTDTEVEDGAGMGQKYTSSSSLGKGDENDDGVVINDFPNSFGRAGVHDFLTKKKTRPLKWRKKLYEFYAAPISKYISHTIAYAVFLSVYTYICLVKTPNAPSGPELYVTACMFNFGCEKIRGLIAMEPTRFMQKLQVWHNDTKWNIFDTLAIVIYLFAFGLRCSALYLVPYARVIYATDICYWYVRSLRFIGVNKFFGPFVLMIGRMIENMMYFVVLLLVVLMAFGVCRQSILYPNEEPHWRLARHIFYQPYFMLYGEVFAPDIDPECNPDCTEYGECGAAADGSLLVPCNVGRWVTPIVMTIYLLVANILLINLLIASFNTIYNSVNARSLQFWNFQRFSVVLEYEEKPALPAPFTVFSHVHRIWKYIYRRCKGKNPRFESGLKLFLSKFDLERLYDFEEECVEGTIKQKEQESQKKTDIRVKNVQDMMEEVKLKMEDLERWETMTNESAQGLEFRLQRLEEVAQQTASHLAVIHRFMTTQAGSQMDLRSGSVGTLLDPELGLAPSSPSERIKKASNASARDQQAFIELQHMIENQAESRRKSNMSRHETGESELAHDYPDDEPVSDDLDLQHHESQEEAAVNNESDAEGGKAFTIKIIENPPPAEIERENEKSKDLLDPKQPTGRKRRQSESSAGDQGFRVRISLKGKKLIKSKKGGSMKLRHTSSGGSSIDLYRPKKNKLIHRRSSRRTRLLTESSTKSADGDDLGLSQGREVSHRRKHKSQDEDEECEENYDEFDLMADIRDRPGRTRTDSGPGYLRSMSECLPQGSNAAMTMTTGSACSHGDSDDDGGGSLSLRTRQKILFAAKHRRQIHGKRRDYTSITDELELMIAASPPLDLRDANSSPSPQPIPAIQVETECLHDAEEADYELMESIIHKRLRRDSTNLHASFEELVTKSIIDSASRPASPFIQRQAAVVSLPYEEPEEEFLSVETEKPPLDIKVIRKSEPTGDLDQIASTADGEEMKTTSATNDVEDHIEVKDTKC